MVSFLSFASLPLPLIIFHHSPRNSPLGSLMSQCRHGPGVCSTRRVPKCPNKFSTIGRRWAGCPSARLVEVIPGPRPNVRTGGYQHPRQSKRGFHLPSHNTHRERERLTNDTLPPPAFPHSTR
jgi:hypothetical protein